MNKSPYFLNLVKNEYRTSYCGTVTTKEVDQEIICSGWIESKRDHGQLLFVSLRDFSGILQCVFEDNTDAFKIVDQASRESVIWVKGKIVKRTKETCNPNLPTGEIELKVTECKVLSKARVIPFDNHQPISEELRLEYRYLYLRREKMQKILSLRADVINYLRNAMREQGFLEVQTPILTASSPEGARDYLVPSPIHKGKFYALPQAPQQFKQILMASGVNKYYQVAPCFRAEASRADRSPGEFYQLDFEIAFATQDIVFAAIEPVIKGVFKEFYHGYVTEGILPIIKYDDALEWYCSDKPDLRNPLKYIDITQAMKDNPPNVLKTAVLDKDFVAKILPVKGANTLSRAALEGLQAMVIQQGLGGLAYAKLDKVEGGKNECGKNEWSGPGSKMIPESILNEVLSEDGVVFLLAGKKHLVNKAGGVLRNQVYYGALGNKPAEQMLLCWIVDFPMYELDEHTNQIAFSHNPFSMPQGGMDSLLNDDPLTIKAWQYDLVCNGIELSSGAIRNHDPQIMKKAFEIAGYTFDQTREMFGAMMDAFECGVPPHGGSAPGIDRIIMMLAGEDNIREIIPFPLSQNAQDLMMKAPASLTMAQLKELGLKIDEDEISSENIKN